MKNQQTTTYPIQALLIGALLGYGLVAMARGRGKVLAPGTRILTADRDTVLGTPRGVPSFKVYMSPSYRVVIRNSSGNTVTVDSILIRPDSRSLPARSLPARSFSVRSFSARSVNAEAGEKPDARR